MATYRKLVCKKLSSNFREATEIVTAPIPTTVAKDHVLLKMIHVGINASDINFTTGHYFATKPELPFDTGMEGIGQVVLVGSGVKDCKVGDFMYCSKYGCYAEYLEVKAGLGLYKINDDSPENIAMVVSGLTASLALECAGRMTTNETVLVTAAAGGTGSYAVQLAKLAGNHVIGTCSTEEKAKVLKDLGCDRVIVYTKENLGEVLTKEYPNGIDIIYECVGGETFMTCVDHLAVRGRLIVVGMISQYEDQSVWTPSTDNAKVSNLLPGLLLKKSASVCGFFLLNYYDKWREHLGKLTKLQVSGKLKALVEPTVFEGIDSVVDAVEFMYQKKNVGKIVAKL